MAAESETRRSPRALEIAAGWGLVFPGGGLWGGQSRSSCGTSTQINVRKSQAIQPSLADATVTWFTLKKMNYDCETFKQQLLSSHQTQFWASLAGRDLAASVPLCCRCCSHNAVNPLGLSCQVQCTSLVCEGNDSTLDLLDLFLNLMHIFYRFLYTCVQHAPLCGCWKGIYAKIYMRINMTWGSRQRGSFVCNNSACGEDKKKCITFLALTLPPSPPKSPELQSHSLVFHYARHRTKSWKFLPEFTFSGAASGFPHCG